MRESTLSDIGLPPASMDRVVIEMSGAGAPSSGYIAPLGTNHSAELAWRYPEAAAVMAPMSESNPATTTSAAPGSADSAESTRPSACLQSEPSVEYSATAATGMPYSSSARLMSSSTLLPNASPCTAATAVPAPESDTSCARAPASRWTGAVSRNTPSGTDSALADEDGLMTASELSSTYSRICSTSPLYVGPRYTEGPAPPACAPRSASRADP